MAEKLARQEGNLEILNPVSFPRDLVQSSASFCRHISKTIHRLLCKMTWVNKTKIKQTKRLVALELSCHQETQHQAIIFVII